MGKPGQSRVDTGSRSGGIYPPGYDPINSPSPLPPGYDPLAPNAPPLSSVLGTQATPRTYPQAPTLSNEDFFGLPALKVIRQHQPMGRDWSIAEFLAMMTYAQSIEASDVHIKSGEPPRVRTYEGLASMNRPEFQDAIMGGSIQDFYEYMLNLARLPERPDIDHGDTANFSVRIDNNSVRICAFREVSGIALSIRFYYNQHLSMDYLNLPQLITLTQRQAGLILCTGPRGSGKTTTAAAIINHLNELENLHIATIECPVEYIHQDKCCRVTQRAIGQHVREYTQGLDSALKQDPDLIFLGEIRTREIALAALEAAETGHLIISTMNAPSTVRAIQRFFSWFPDQESTIPGRLADSLAGITNQLLLPSRSGKFTHIMEILINNAETREKIRLGQLDLLDEIMDRSPEMSGWQTALDALLLNQSIHDDVWETACRNPRHAKPESISKLIPAIPAPSPV